MSDFPDGLFIWLKSQHLTIIGFNPAFGLVSVLPEFRLNVFALRPSMILSIYFFIPFRGPADFKAAVVESCAPFWLTFCLFVCLLPLLSRTVFCVWVRWKGGGDKGFCDASFIFMLRLTRLTAHPVHPVFPFWLRGHVLFFYANYSARRIHFRNTQAKYLIQIWCLRYTFFLLYMKVIT